MLGAGGRISVGRRILSLVSLQALEPSLEQRLKIVKPVTAHIGGMKGP